MPAALIVSVLFGGLAELVGAPGVAVLSMLLGLLLCLLYVATGSLLPGVAMAAAAPRRALGVPCALAPATIAALAVGCAVPPSCSPRAGAAGAARRAGRSCA